MSEAQSFLPASLRPAKQSPRARTRLPLRWWVQFTVSVFVCLGAGTLLAQWRLDAVEISGCRGLPTSAVKNLEDLQGQWIPTADLDKIRQDVERWPGVAGVSIELKLPATLRVQAHPDEICGSIPMGRTWRGVNCNGRLSCRLSEPVLPVLQGFNLNEEDLRSALSAGSRLCDGTNGNLLRIRKITPSDFEITMSGSRPGTTSLVKVLPQGNATEQWWRATALNGQAPAWADLRFDQRIVIRRAG